MKTKIIIILVFLCYLAYAIDYSHKVTNEQWKEKVMEENY